MGPARSVKKERMVVDSAIRRKKTSPRVDEFDEFSVSPGNTTEEDSFDWEDQQNKDDLNFEEMRAARTPVNEKSAKTREEKRKVKDLASQGRRPRSYPFKLS